jgi:trimeric autotransporter adhesin
MSQAGIISIQSTPSVPTTFTGNSGTATPVANNLNVVTANSTVKFVGSGSTLTEDFGLSNLLLGASGSSISGAAANVGVGFQALNVLSGGIANTAIGQAALFAVTTGIQNTATGNGALLSITSSSANSAYGYLSEASLTSGVNNCGFGWGALQSGTTYNDCTAIGTQSLITCSGSNNVAMGSSSGTSVTSGINNTTVGTTSLNIITTGSYNTALGYAAGTSYTTSDSSNVAIMNSGVSGESHVIRIGTQGTGAGQQNKCFLAGVLNTSSGRVIEVTTPGSYPYTTLITDHFIKVDTSSARTIIPMASPLTGTTYIIKDTVGSAAANNITITPSGKNIDGAASYTLGSNYASVIIVYNGSEWSVT